MTSYPQDQNIESQTPARDAPVSCEFEVLRRTSLAGWMLLLPIFSFVIALSAEFEPAYKEFHSFWLILFNLETASWFAIPIVSSVLLVAASILQPRLASIPLVRVGVKSALALAISYCVAVVGASLAFAFILVGPSLLLVFALRRIIKDGRVRHAASMVLLTISAAIGIALLTLGDRPNLPGALVFWTSILVTNGPFICTWIIGDLLKRTSAEPAPRSAEFAAGVVVAGTWYYTISRSFEQYNTLPAPPDCYIATAAASGHPFFVRSTPGRDAWPVNRQLQTLKAGEIVLLSRWPSTHWALRRVYDRIGPPLAALLRGHPLLADAAFLLLVPIHLAVRGALAMVLPNSHRELVAGIYR